MRSRNSRIISNDQLANTSRTILV